MDNSKNIPLPLLIAEVRNRVEGVLSCGLPAIVTEIILKEAWLRASVAANKEVSDEYKAYSEQLKESEEEEQ